MTKRSSQNNSDTGSCFLVMLGIGACVTVLSWIVSLIGGLFNSIGHFLFVIGLGLKAGYPFLIALVMLILGGMVIFLISQKKPLNYKQVTALSKYNSKKYIKSHYIFLKDAGSVSWDLKSKVNTCGRWNDVNEKVMNFPSLISSLLMSDHYNWNIVAIERNGVVYKIWSERTVDSQCVTLPCDINDIIRKCQDTGGYTILRIHNHPTPDPGKMSCLSPGKQDLANAKECASLAAQEGINWIDFICSNGRFIKYYSKISEAFEVEGGSKSDIIDRIGITEGMDEEVHREYNNTRRLVKVLRNRAFIIACIIALIVVLFIVGRNVPQ